MSDALKREHVVDGIEEYDNPLPRWWLYLFYLTIAFAGVYCVVYPSTWFWGGTQGWSSSGQYEAAMAEAGKAAPARTATTVSPEEVARMAHDPAALAAGKAVFAKNCAVCHGEKAEGKIGPSLVDGTWLYGSEPSDLLETITNGRPKGMPKWGKLLKPEEIQSVAAFVYSLRGSEHASR